MKDSFKICFFLPLWQRPEITKICFEGLKRLCNYHPKIKGMVHCVVSEDDLVDLCNEYGFTWTFYKNEPLGEKLNAGLEGALNYKWDYLIQLGSDDLIANKVLDIYYPLMKEGRHYWGLNTIGFINAENGATAKMQTTTIFGLGRVMSREVVENCSKSFNCVAKDSFVSKNFCMRKGKPRWINEKVMKGLPVEVIEGPKTKLWEDHLQWALDGNSNWLVEMINGYKHEMVHTDEVLLVDIKSEVNIGKFKNYDKPSRRSTLDEILGNFPERKMVEKLWQ